MYKFKKSASKNYFNSVLYTTKTTARYKVLCSRYTIITMYKKHTNTHKASENTYLVVSIIHNTAYYIAPIFVVHKIWHFD